jgi:hypothetical protein
LIFRKLNHGTDEVKVHSTEIRRIVISTQTEVAEKKSQSAIAHPLPQAMFSGVSFLRLR